MSVTETQSTVVTSGTTTTDPLSQFFSVTGTSNPTYLVVNALDRDEYTVAANGDTGSFVANGDTIGLSSADGDGRGAGIIYTWQASTHQYVNATYGAFSQLDYTSSDSANDVTNISLFTTSSASVAQSDASDAYALMQGDAGGYDGSVTFANDPKFAGVVPQQATPNGIAAAAMNFVGAAWNENGCWVLASSIAAEAGAGLPVQSTEIGIAGKPNGEWAVLYNGPAGASGNWQSLVSTGDIIAFETGNGGGHITTCVSGTGNSAMLVDNITYENAQGQIVNSANDGSPNDVTVASPHAASQEWSGVNGANVVIYALDTPVVSDKTTTSSVDQNGTLSLATLFSAVDPAHKSITKYQIYNSASTDSILLSGHAQTANSAATAVTGTSLSALSLLAGGTATTDTLEIRAFNGTYWGDWQSENVTVLGTQPPTQVSQTPNQTWKQGQVVNFVLPSNLFKDPQGLALTYSANGAAGASLPSWLTFNSGTRAFTGTVPAGTENFGITVAATDSAGASASENFSVTVPAAAPTLAVKTPAQTWAESSGVSLALPTGTFTDPQSEALSVKATLSNGAALPGWLHFDPGSLTFSGTAPATAQSLQLKLTATDTSNLSAYDLFTASVSNATGHMMALSDWQDAAPATHPAPTGSLFYGAARDLRAPQQHFILPHDHRSL